jgi:nickel-dependent lactate racemase
MRRFPMLVKIPYETAEEKGVNLELEIPDTNVLRAFIPREPGPVADLTKEVAKAIENPVKGKRFSELIGQGKKVAFVIDNQFRAAPMEKILPPLVAEALQAGSEVCVLVGNGKMAPLSTMPEELKKHVGAEVLDRVPVYCNDVTKPEDYTYIGTTSFGTPLFILKQGANADSIVTVSTTQATPWGYGGAGMLIPAISSDETIEINHRMYSAPDMIPGNNDCKVEQDKYEAMELAGYDMSINVIVANNGDTIFVNAGEPRASHQKAIEFYDKIYKFDISDLKEKADIVITGSSSTTNHLYTHTGWGTVNCLPVSKEGATIIQATPCPGYAPAGWHGFVFFDSVKDYMPPNKENHEKAIKALFKGEREWAYASVWYPMYKVMLVRHLKVVTLEQNIEDAKAIGLDATSSLQDAFKEAMRKHGPDSKVAVVPFGRYTILAE